MHEPGHKNNVLARQHDFLAINEPGQKRTMYKPGHEKTMHELGHMKGMQYPGSKMTMH